MPDPVLPMITLEDFKRFTKSSVIGVIDSKHTDLTPNLTLPNGGYGYSYDNRVGMFIGDRRVRMHLQIVMTVDGTEKTPFSVVTSGTLASGAVSTGS